VGPEADDRWVPTLRRRQLQAVPPPAEPEPTAAPKPKARLKSEALKPDVPTPSGDRRRLGDLLLDQGHLDADALRDAVLAQSESGGKRLGTLLLEAGVIDEETLTSVLSEQLGLPRADLRVFAPDPATLELLPEAIARTHRAVPVGMEGDILEVAVADPSPELTTTLREATGRPVRLVLATQSEIARLLDASYRVLGGVDRFVQSFEADEAHRVTRASADQTEASDDAPVVQVVRLLLTQALRDRASDVHIEPQQTRLRVRFRIDGSLHDALELPIAMATAVVSRLKVMANLNIVERRRPQDGQLSLTIDDRVVDMRLSVLSTIWGEKCVIRLLDTNRSAKRVSELGMPADTFAEFVKLIRAPFGMVVCAGPTGSGKTTTLYAALSELNVVDRNITTVEDPVEYVFEGINQIQVSEQTGLTFATGLKSILRQDPDVILVGEIRDAETARVAVQSALTGHFVLSTLHGTDSVAALHRLLDMGIESFLIASSIAAVVGQRLVRRICPACQVAYEPSAEELSFYEEGGGQPKKAFLHGEGCQYCAQTGYQDRIGVYELLRVTPEMKRLIVGWASQDELRNLAVAQGMRTLRQQAIQLVEQDVTTISEVIKTIYGL
jgi:type IV pilus assembly protein PilB